MKHLLFTITLGLILTACVPLKKYQDLEANYNKCQEEREDYKTKSIDYENQVKELDVKLNQLQTDIEVLRADTTSLGIEYRNLEIEHQKVKETNLALETKYE